MPAPPRSNQLLDQNAELAARLKVSEESLRQLREAHEQLQVQHHQALERKGLLEEEVRWLKGQLYGRSSERLSDSGVSADQKMLFNEAEVLAAIEAAEGRLQGAPRLSVGGRSSVQPPSVHTDVRRGLAIPASLATCITSTCYTRSARRWRSVRTRCLTGLS